MKIQGLSAILGENPCISALGCKAGENLSFCSKMFIMLLDKKKESIGDTSFSNSQVKTGIFHDLCYCSINIQVNTAIICTFLILQYMILLILIYFHLNIFLNGVHYYHSGINSLTCAKK